MQTTELGRRLKRLRQANGFSQAHMADLLGFTDTSSVSRLESGQRTISVTLLTTWAEACGTTAEDVLSGAPLTVAITEGEAAS
jgi:transcriptional regulator with XRE-family HTH domain